MYVLGVTDSGAGDAPLERTADMIVDRLSRAGRVGVLRYDATIADGTADLRASGLTPGGDVTYALGADGDWSATGTERSVEDVLDSLALECSYAVVIGHELPSYPSVVVGDEADHDLSGLVIAAVESPGELDIEAVVSDLEATEPYETLDSLVARIKRSPAAERAGAIATFTGRVRAKDDDEDPRTEYLEFEKYEGVADERMAALEAELEARDGVYGVLLYHRTGIVADGDDIVHVVVLAGHRTEAFRTVEDGINRLKDEVPLFKKEITVDDEFWVHDSSE
ncbi:molybdopterin synthase [Natrialbaceae archaeon A-chndr2]